MFSYALFFTASFTCWFGLIGGVSYSIIIYLPSYLVSSLSHVHEHDSTAFFNLRLLTQICLIYLYLCTGAVSWK